MGRQIIHRLLISLPALLGVLFLCFCLLQVVPADPAIIIAGPDAKKETVEAIRKDLGLDQPIVLQFVNYIGRVAQGDLGRSIISNKRVIEELAHTIGPTVELMVAAMLLAVPIGLLLGTLAAVKPWPHSRPRHHGHLSGRRVDARVLHRPSANPGRRLQVGICCRSPDALVPCGPAACRT